MLPYIPILIHHLWNVRKCVVSRGLEQRPHWGNRKKKHYWFHCPFNWTIVWVSLFYEIRGGGGGCQGSWACVYLCVCVCVCVWQDNRWRARSLSFSSGTCAVSIAPRDLLIGSQGTSWKIPALPQRLTVKEDWRTTAVTHYSNGRTLKKGRGGRRGGCGAVTEGWRFAPAGPDLEGNRAMSPAVRAPKPKTQNRNDLLSNML